MGAALTRRKQAHEPERNTWENWLKRAGGEFRAAKEDSPGALDGCRGRLMLVDLSNQDQRPCPMGCTRPKVPAGLYTASGQVPGGLRTLPENATSEHLPESTQLQSTSDGHAL